MPRICTNTTEKPEKKLEIMVIDIFPYILLDIVNTVSCEIISKIKSKYSYIQRYIFNLL